MTAATRLALIAMISALAIAAGSRVASAYPQFQPGRDPTCTGCHISPAGGGLLNENGLATAAQDSQFGGPPEAAHGALAGWSWLTLGGDLRFAAGAVEDHGLGPQAFPMQLEFAASAKIAAGFSANATIGATRGNNTVSSFILSREHYVMWQADPDAPTGLFVRVGRFMPVYGLRLVDHTALTERYGQTPLYGETYGAAIEYLADKYEVHATGFVHDPIQESQEHGNGGALYAELHPGKFAIAAQARYANGPDDVRTAGGGTGKYDISDDLVLQAEASVIHQRFTAGGPARNQLVSELVASWFPADAWQLDVGVGQFDEDLHVPKVDREAFDVDLSYYLNAHWNFMLLNRVQTIDFGRGGRSSGWCLLQLHYRL